MRLLGDPFTDEERAAFLRHALSLLGVPWRHQGRTERGIDCAGVPWWCMAKVRSVAKPRTDYGRLPHNNKLREELIRYLGEPVPGLPQPGDIATLKWSGEENHVVVVVPHHERPFGFLHASNSDGKVVQHGADAQWRHRIVERWVL